PGKYKLRVSQLASRDRDPHHVDLEITDQKEIVRNFDLPLVPMQQLSGRVIDADGRPVANQLVQLSCLEPIDHGTDLFQATTNEDGAFQIDRPFEPAYIAASIQKPLSEGAAIIGPDVKHVVIQIHPLIQAHGRLVDKSGNPVTEGFIESGIKGPSNY